MHRGFCCTASIVKYFDPDTDVQVAEIYHLSYVDTSKPPVRTIRRLRIGPDVYINRDAVQMWDHSGHSTTQL